MATINNSSNGNFVSTMLISKMHKKENYTLSTKLKYTLMHPKLSIIPHQAISYFIILLNILTGLGLVVILSILKITDVIVILLAFLAGYIAMNFILKRYYNKPQASVSELNTFIVASKLIDPKSNLTFISPESRINFENKIKFLHDSYKKDVFNLIKKEVKKDYELKYSLKVLRTAGADINVSLDQELVQELYAWVEKTLEKLYKGTRISYWNNKDGRFRLVVTNANQERQFIEVPNDISDLIDELNLLIFTNHYRDVIEPLLRQILALSKPLVDESFYFDYSSNPDPASNNPNFSEFFRVLLSKCLGMQEVLKTTKRQFDRLNEAKHDLEEESKDSTAELAQLIEQFSINGTMKELLEDLDTLREFLSKITLHLRKLHFNAIPQGNANAFEAISNFYFALEKLRFISNWFEDIASYTNISGGSVADIESSMMESIPSGVILRIKDIYKTFNTTGGTVYAVRGVSFDVKEGEFIGLYGPSGSGKTTLLNIMAGLDKTDVGDVFIDGISLRSLSNGKLTKLRRDKMGFIFQFYNLIPILKNKENVSYPADLAGSSNSKQASSLLESVQLKTFEKQYPNKLSGGQMQRVTIARSLINTPKILFADEPTGDLDSVTGKEIMNLLSKFNKENKTTIIFVTHDESLLSYCSRVIKMTDGKIIS